MTVWQRIKAFFGFAGVRHGAEVLSQQILTSLQLQPVSLASQIAGVVGILVFFWDSLNRPVLIVWAVCVAVTLSLWLYFARKVRADKAREAHIRRWIRSWMIQSVLTGAVWGFAGIAFLLPARAIDQVVLVAVVVAVVFASWPAFSCWLPSLTAFTLIALAPMLFAVAAAYDVGRTAIGAILIGLTTFVLYSGRRLNALVVLAITRDAQNAGLVQKLKEEKAVAENARRETAEASERRARFFAGANHDLRQPLQAMGIYLQILKAQQTEQNKEIIAQLQTSAGTISGLVEQILEISRIETGRIEVHPENVRVSRLFEAIESEMAPLAAEKGLQFKTRPVNAVITTDVALVSRILRNLITNAVRYTDKRGARVTLAARRVGPRIVIGVYDEGPGIASEERGKIFEAFYRGNAVRETSRGYGLGLSIVRALAIRLGIAVTVGSRVGRGSVFRLEFLEQKERIDPKSNDEGAEEPVRLKIAGKVALIEDAALVREALAAVVRGWGAQVLESDRATPAFISKLVQAASAAELTALISDYNLGEGELTGLEALMRVQSESAVPVPGVLLTAVSEDEIRANYRTLIQKSAFAQVPMPIIVQKPASPEELASAVHEAIASHRRLRRRRQEKKPPQSR